MKNNITITQIAQESGVSIATVSRVLNNTVPVSEDTKKRVEAVIKKYNFSPNALAQGLVRRKSMTLGVMLPDISNPYFSSMFTEIERFALEAGYSVFLCNTFFSNGIKNSKNEEDYFQIMIDKHVDGVLIIGGQVDLNIITFDYENALKRLCSCMPVVVIGKPIKDIDCIFIERETGNGVVTALNCLVSLGHKRIAFVGGEPGVTITEIRLNAYKSTLKSLKLPLYDELISLSNYYAADGYSATKSLIDKNAHFSAIIAMNDNVAIGAIRALADCELSVPNHKAVISCDQFLSAEYQLPRLTSVDQHNEMFGMMVINTLLSSIKGVIKPVELSFKPELIVRESCGSHLGIRNFD